MSSSSYQLSQALGRLLPAQFALVVFKLGIPSGHLHGPQSLKAVEVVTLLENQGRLDVLEAELRKDEYFGSHFDRLFGDGSTSGGSGTAGPRAGGPGHEPSEPTPRPAFAYLTQDELDELFRTAVDAGLAEASTLKHLRQVLSDAPGGDALDLSSSGAPNQQLRNLLNTLNTTRQLPSGLIPFLILAREIRQLTYRTEHEGYFIALLQKLSEVQGQPSGEQFSKDEQKAIEEQYKKPKSDLLPFSFVDRAMRVGSIIAQFRVPRYDHGASTLLTNQKPDLYLGTAWLVAPDLVITNYHVVKARPQSEHPVESDLKSQGQHSNARFDYNSHHQDGHSIPTTALEAWSRELDYAILRLAEPLKDHNGNQRPLPRLSRVPMLKQDTPQAVNIIQHPEGLPKQVGLRNNLVVSADETVLRYMTDTEHGSSGSPVCDDSWTVVALHRATIYQRQATTFQGEVYYWANTGTQMSAILDDLETRYPNLYDTIATTQHEFDADANDW